MSKASIPSVIDGLLELPNGKAVKLESVEGFQRLVRSDFRSFRFENGIGSYTCRKEKVKGTDGYWYGYQRVGGKVTKRYIGKTIDLTQARLIEVGGSFEALPKKRAALPKFSSVLPNELDNDSSTSMLPNLLGNNKLVSGLSDEPNKSFSGLPGELPSELLSELKLELAQLKADNEHLKQELSDCHQALESCQRICTQTQEALDPAKLLNQLRQQNKRTKATLPDLETIVSLVVPD